MKRAMTTREIGHDLLNDEYAGWTYNGAMALAEYLERLEEDSGEEIEYDRVAIRCDFSEYSSALECAENYTCPEDKEDYEEDATEETALAYLQDNTSVIQFEGGIIIQDW